MAVGFMRGLWVARQEAENRGLNEAIRRTVIKPRETVPTNLRNETLRDVMASSVAD